MSKNYHRQETLVYELLSGLDEGELTIRDPEGRERTFGRPGSRLAAKLLVHNRSLYAQLIKNGSLGFGESYVNGDWDVDGDRVVDLIGILARNDLKSKVRGNLGFALRFLFHRVFTRPTTSARSRRNVEHHYDLGNRFYALFLDASMTYSCGYAHTLDDSLEAMQTQKYERICRKLALSPGERLLDIGCGWGGMLLHAAKEHGIRGVGVTLSREQQEWARRKIEQENLSDRVEVLLQDYREVGGTFDKLVSIGMFEHVGRAHYSTFMHQANQRLRPGGIGLLHTISTTDPPSVPADPWVTTYIFPGGRFPRLGEIVREMDAAGFTVAHIDNLKPHYALTLRHWKTNFDNNREKILQLGPPFDERFLRLWNYWLQCSEASFRHSNLELSQVLFYKGNEWPFPLRLMFC